MVHRCCSKFSLYNYRIDSHRARCGNNYGSIFNITNNCSGNHGGFWGGVGAGLGLGLGGMLSGMFCNFMGGFTNMFGFNNMFGMGNMFGLGNLYQPNWANYSQYDNGYNSWITNRRTKDKSDSCGDDCKCNKHEKFEDADDTKIKELADKIKSATTKEALQKIKTDLKEYKKLLTDNYTNDKATEEAAIDKHLKDIDDKLKEIEGNSSSNPKLEDESKAKLAESDEKIQAGNNVKIKIGDTEKEISQLTSDDIKGIGIDTELTKDQITVLVEQVKTFENNNTANKYETIKEILNSDIPASLKIAIKKSYYLNGATNVTENDIKNNFVKYANDIEGEKNNTIRKVNNDTTNLKVSEDGKTITLHDKILNKDVSYTYVENKDGESIYKSPKGQEYVLQKVGNDYVLNQYFWHVGSNIIDQKRS